jgi:hypothetical protein
MNYVHERDSSRRGRVNGFRAPMNLSKRQVNALLEETDDVEESSNLIHGYVQDTHG